MAHQWMRCNLATATFPFETELGDRTIVMSRYDQNFDYLSSIGEPIKDRGLPRAFYMHNCMPTAAGYQSIGYDNDVLSTSPGNDLGFDTIFSLKYEFNNAVKRMYFSPAGGKNYILDATIGQWASVNPFPLGTIASDTLVTCAFVNGTTYFYFKKIGCFKYVGNYTDPATHVTGPAIVPVTLIGLDPTTVTGICAANGYLITWNDVAIAWSSTTNELDFTPSLITGAASGTPQFTDGKIQLCLPISGGFLLYCESNTVSSTYSGNVRFPWIFAEVAGAGGCSSLNKISWRSNFAVHYAWTTSGLQELTRTSAKDFYPEVTDFLASLSFEDFNETTLVFTQSYLSTPLDIKVNAIADRYVVISYGVVPGNYTHALVFDLALARWGKLKVAHRECFEWFPPNLYGSITYGQLTGITYGSLVNTSYGDFNTGITQDELPKKNIGFLQEDGNIEIINFDLAQTEADGVLILGKFEFERNKWITGQQYAVENVINGNSFTFYIIPTTDGKNLLTPVPGILKANKSGTLNKWYQKRVSGLNLSMLFVGAFNLTSFIWDFTTGGDR